MSDGLVQARGNAVVGVECTLPRAPAPRARQIARLTLVEPIAKPDPLLIDGVKYGTLLDMAAAIGIGRNAIINHLDANGCLRYTLGNGEVIIAQSRRILIRSNWTTCFSEDDVRNAAEKVSKLPKNQVSLRDLAVVVKLSYTQTRRGLENGNFNYTTADGETISIKAYQLKKFGEMFFLQEDVDRLTEVLSLERIRIMSLREATKKINECGVKVSYDEIQSLWDYATNEDGYRNRVFSVGGKAYNICLKPSCRELGKSFDVYLYSEEVDVLALWYQIKSNLRKLVDVEVELDLRLGGLGWRVDNGQLPTVKIGKDYYIDNDTYEALKTEFDNKKVPKDALKLREALEGLGQNYKTRYKRVKTVNGTTTLTFQNEFGEEQIIALIKDKDGRYWIKKPDFELIERVQKAFEEEGRYLDVRALGRIFGRDELTVCQWIETESQLMDIYRTGHKVPIVRRYGEKFGSPYVRAVDVLGFYRSQNKGFDRFIESRTTETKIRLCERYSISIPLDMRGNITLEELGVMLFYKDLFFNPSEDEAADTAMRFLAGVRQKTDLYDAELAKLWLCRSLSMRTEHDGLMDMLDDIYKKTNHFSVEPKPDSKFFHSGTPFFKPYELERLYGSGDMKALLIEVIESVRHRELSL